MLLGLRQILAPAIFATMFGYFGYLPSAFDGLRAWPIVDEVK